MLIALSLLTAFAGFSLEGPSYEARSDANEFAKSAKQEGQKGRVVRRYRDGAGWEFVVRFEDFEDEANARTAGTMLSEKLAARLVLLDGDGNQVAVLESSSDGQPATEGSETEQPQVDWMEAMIEAHGPGRTVFSEAERVKVAFTRTLGDGRVARHVYARRGTDLFLSIEGVEGDVKSSETVALADSALLRHDGKESTEDLQRARETIGRFGPTSLWPMVLDLEELSQAHGDLRDLEERGTAKVDGATCKVYGSSNVLIAVGKDGLIRRVAIGGDERVMEYDDYQAIEDVHVPRKVRIAIKGEPESSVEIQEIELNGDLDEAWFAPPK